MSVRCKFKCIETGQSSMGEEVLHNAKFRAVFGDKSPENREFFKYTPSGELTLGVVKEQHFEAGKEYYLEITPAPTE